MHATEGAIEDDVHHLAPFRETHAGNMFLTPQCRVVDEDIDTPKFLQRCVGERNRGLVVADVAKNGDRLAAGLRDLADDAIGLGLVRPDIHDNGSAGFRQRQCDRTADITSGTGDNGNFPGEFFALSHEISLPSQKRQVDLAFIKLRQLFERARSALVIPTAMTDVERELLFDVRTC